MLLFILANQQNLFTVSSAMRPILLSVLIPSLPSRLAKLTELLEVLAAQPDPRMEVLVFLDNRMRSSGLKRNALMLQAAGRYLCHIDDDDLVSTDFTASLMPVLEHAEFDLVAYNATCTLNGSEPFLVRTVLGAENEQPKHLGPGRYSDIVRWPWHWCAWRSDFARRFAFPVEQRGDEDAYFLCQALPAVRTWHKIERVLYRHRYDARTSEFP